MASPIKLSPSGPKTKYKLQMKLIKVTKGDFGNYSGQKRESIYCHKSIELPNLSQEATAMLARLMHKIFEAGVNS